MKILTTCDEIKKIACDESYSLEKIKSTAKLLDMPEELFLESSAQLASLHFSAAKNLMQRLEQSAKLTRKPSTYTFVTGDGGGKPNEDRVRYSFNSLTLTNPY